MLFCWIFEMKNWMRCVKEEWDEVARNLWIGTKFWKKLIKIRGRRREKIRGRRREKMMINKKIRCWRFTIDTMDMQSNG